PQGGAKHHLTATYNVGFGKWFSPYIGWRLGLNYGSMHFDDGAFSRAKLANANFDIMWDMFNSFGGVNTKRVFSIVPFVGVGGAYTFDIKTPYANIARNGGGVKDNSWTIPVSTGLQLRFRLSQYVNFFLEGRAMWAGDNFNGVAYGDPVDFNISAIGGLTFKIGGDSFKSYNPCNDLAMIAGLNNQINDLRGELAATATALAAAQAQLPCPPQQIVVEEVAKAQPQAMLATVRFKINSARISSEEMVNVYNVAEYLKANPETNLDIKGYADKATGSAAYNMKLSERRAKAVYDVLTKNYGIDASRLTIVPEGSNTQVYGTNNWNRIVIFATK
ncbi:MAG: OmpA family protein, partial [Muribaculaceae bacterium]|nr:OmpA family protein [Muribaculaceae bacterium]